MLKKRYFFILFLMLLLVWIMPIHSFSTQMRFCYENILDSSYTKISFDYGEGYSEYTSRCAFNTNNEAIFDILLGMFQTNRDIRINIGDEKQNFVLRSIQVFKNGIKICEITGKELLDYVDYSYNIELKEGEDNTVLCSTGINAQLYMKESFRDIITKGFYYNVKERIILTSAILSIVFVCLIIKLFAYWLHKINEKERFAFSEQIEDIRQFLKRNKQAIILLIIYAFITYGYEITNWTLTIDEEIFSFRSKSVCVRSWIGDGRWGLGALKLILPTYKVLPYFNGICAIIVLIICALVLSYIIQKYILNRIVVTITCIMFITMPLHSYYLMFDTFSVEIAIGFLCAIMSGYCCTEYIIKKSRAQMIMSIFLLTFSIAVYQSYFFVYVCIICLVMILTMLNDNKNTSQSKDLKLYFYFILKSIAVLIISMTIYAIINLVLQCIFGKSNYINGYFRWSYMDPAVCVEGMRVYLNILFTHPADLFKGGNLLKICYLIYAVQFIILMFKMKGKRIAVILVYMGLCLSMCFNYILFAGAVPIRSQQVLAIYICFAAVSLFAMIEKKSWQKFVFLTICLLALYQSSIVAEMFYSENIRQKQDENLLSRIIAKVEELNLGEIPDYPVVIVGQHDWDSEYKIQSEQFCTSMLHTGADVRVYVWMKVLGYNYHIPTEEQQYRAEQIAQDMPEWPYEGSVALIDDTVIVNLGTDN